MEIYLLAYMFFGVTVAGLTLYHYRRDESRTQGEAINTALAAAIIGPAVLVIGIFALLGVIVFMLIMAVVGIIHDMLEARRMMR